MRDLSVRLMHAWVRLRRKTSLSPSVGERKNNGGVEKHRGRFFLGFLVDEEGRGDGRARVEVDVLVRASGEGLDHLGGWGEGEEVPARLVQRLGVVVLERLLVAVRGVDGAEVGVLGDEREEVPDEGALRGNPSCFASVSTRVPLDCPMKSNPYDAHLSSSLLAT